jgi:hypothetical protein
MRGLSENEAKQLGFAVADYDHSFKAGITRLIQGPGS